MHQRAQRASVTQLLHKVGSRPMVASRSKWEAAQFKGVNCKQEKRQDRNPTTLNPKKLSCRGKAEYPFTPAAFPPSYGIVRGDPCTTCTIHVSRARLSASAGSAEETREVVGRLTEGNMYGVLVGGLEGPWLDMDGCMCVGGRGGPEDRTQLVK